MSLSRYYTGSSFVCASTVCNLVPVKPIYSSHHLAHTHTLSTCAVIMADEGALLAVQEANRKLGTGVLAAGVVVIFTTVAVFFSSGSRGRGKARQKLGTLPTHHPIAHLLHLSISLSYSTTPSPDPPRWLPENPGKRWTEIFFLKASVLWIVWFGGIVVSGVYEHFGPWSYMLVCSAMAAPYLFGPFLHPNQVRSCTCAATFN